MKWSSFFLNLILLAITILFCLGAAEIALRMIYPKPGGDQVTSLEYHHRWVFNSDGFRDEEFEGKLKNGKENVIFLGDSFTAGLGVEREETFASFLSEKVKDRYETFNLGKAATGTFNQLDILKQYIERIHPKHVILFFFWNDVADNFLMPKDSPYRFLQTAELSNQKPFFTFLEPIKPWLYKSMLYQFISQRYRIVLTRLGVSKLDCGMEFDLFEKESKSLAVKLAWENTRKSLLEMSALCQARSARFWVVYLPKREQLNHWENVVKFYKADAGRYDRFMVNKTLQFFCDKQHIPYFDTSFELDSRPDKETYYYKFDSHLTRNGNQAFFDVFYSKLAPSLQKNV